jgi:hypothetical protein
MERLVWECQKLDRCEVEVIELIWCSLALYSGIQFVLIPNDSHHFSLGVTLRSRYTFRLLASMVLWEPLRVMPMLYRPCPRCSREL